MSNNPGGKKIKKLRDQSIGDIICRGIEITKIKSVVWRVTWVQRLNVENEGDWHWDGDWWIDLPNLKNKTIGSPETLY